MNNLSRKMANRIEKLTGWRRDGIKNVFYDSENRKICFSLIANNRKIQARQFPLDADYLLTMNITTLTLYKVKREELKIGSVTRVSPDGEKFYNSEDVPFVYDTDSRRPWRMGNDRLIEIKDTGMVFDSRMNSMEISYRRAMVLSTQL